jgi:flagellar motor switch protein FliM
VTAPEAPMSAPTNLASAEVYDFRTPQRIAKEQWANLQTICGRLATSLQSVLATRLRQPVTTALGRVEETTVADAISSLASPCVAYPFDPGDGSGVYGVFDLGAPLASYAVDRLLGGLGATVDAKRVVTEMEQRIVKGLVERILATVGDGLKDVGRVKPTIVSCLTSAEGLTEAVIGDGMVLSAFDVKIDKPIGTMTLCLPVSMLTGGLQERRAANARPARAARPDNRAHLEAAIRHARVPLMVQFPAITLPARAVATLAPGQTIQTSLPLDVPVEVRVNGRLRFLGAPGQLHGSVGVRVIRTVPADAGGSTSPTRARIM